MARKPTYEELEQIVKELGRESLERKQAEKALRESEERYWEIASSIPGVVYQFLLKKDGSYSSPYISESASSILDISAKEVIANPYSLFDKIVEDDLDSVNQSIVKSARTMGKWLQEFRIKTKTGEIRWMRATSIPHLLPNGEILWNGVILDISDRMKAQKALQRAHDELERHVEERTAELVAANKQLKAEIEERKQSQEALRESEEKYKTLTESSLTGIYIHQDGEYVFVNDRFAQIHGYKPDELLGEHHLTLIHPDERTRVKQIGSKRLNGEPAPKHYEARRLRKDGEAVWCATIAVRIEYRGKPAIMGNIVDINEHKLAEQALREREAELKIKTNSLKEMNTALRVLLERRDEDKTELEEKVLVNVKELVVPFLEKVKRSQLDPKQLSYIHILESNLNDIISPFIRNLSAKYVNLTPTEIRVAHLIREGKTTKEIGEVMGLSPRTIETHRKNMRKKLGIEKNKGNLRSHLLTLQ